MTRSTVGGVLDLAALAALAGPDHRTQHRPTDAEALQAEVLRLRRQGHSALWIAEALRIDQRQIKRLLAQECTP